MYVHPLNALLHLQNHFVQLIPFKDNLGPSFRHSYFWIFYGILALNISGGNKMVKTIADKFENIVFKHFITELLKKNCVLT